MGEALAIIIAFAALLGISWGVTCAAVWAHLRIDALDVHLGPPERRRGSRSGSLAALAALRSEALHMPAQKKHTNKGRL